MGDGLSFKYSCKVHLAQCIGKKKHQKRKEKKSENQKRKREKNKMQVMSFIVFWCDYLLFYFMGTTWAENVIYDGIGLEELMW